ncbi:DUF2147 domain-containing protein [Bradyrhizobium sp. GCM10027634]|uniref:DUF2147 domain-containing protein n=1 Tax=unclassified Bradyrhizobium TaxID=2631580 RepID=UPI00188B7E9C|nr:MULTISPECIES: DUF2147 domain-containing protein [unclassified Bradyrhizobium]MDN4999568.1 DUF2147 domain-containing protein [Bradyrhizobium sp. WYCCWR 12677]QOZ43507.1 DUF2147 domain-containing protein [Bradyrhizobium sp. CCBAU 53340]
MKRLAISLGTLIAWTAIAPAAQAGSYAFTIGGHRFHVEAARNCRSTACISISTDRSLRPSEDVAIAPPPPAVTQAPQPVASIAPTSPPQVMVVAPPPAPTVPVLAATSSQVVVLPPAPRPAPPRFEAPSPNPPRDEPVLAARPEIKQAANLAPRSDDEAAYMPLGEWESDGAKGTVRIERCGPALCGFALTEASTRGESVLVNMKPKAHDVWTGSIYSRSSGNTYYATMTLKGPGRLYVEACALGRFWCSGNDWRRIEARPEPLITTSRQWGGSRS